jgi:CheY-like chemotaxis protein
MAYQILIVDDEPDMEPLVRQKLRRQIHDKEFEFFFSRNGEEALQRLAEQPGIDLVLTDINMPVMDGLTLLGRLNESDKPVKTVIVSAYGDMPNIRTAMNRGAIDFLTKPIDFDDFELTVRKGLAHNARARKSLQTQQDLIALQHELNVAARIQQWTLPRIFPPFPDRHDFELHAAMAAAKGVSGDLFDFFLLDDTHLGFMIGDVNGTGVGPRSSRRSPGLCCGRRDCGGWRPGSACGMLTRLCRISKTHRCLSQSSTGCWTPRAESCNIRTTDTRFPISIPRPTGRSLYMVPRSRTSNIAPRPSG